MTSIVYLIPTVLAEAKTEVLPAYILDAVKQCQVFFVENERTARRFFKLLWKDMKIDDYEWYGMKEVTAETRSAFQKKILENKIIGIISEAGCPGIADPGQQLVEMAQDAGVPVKPLVGPNSILLALMASGMNGQHFQFHGYLPIESDQRAKSIRSLEAESKQKNCTQIFIETPYRNNQLLETILKTCHPDTRLCVAANLTDDDETILTLSIKKWKQKKFDYHKQPAIFLLAQASFSGT